MNLRLVIGNALALPRRSSSKLLIAFALVMLLGAPSAEAVPFSATTAVGQGADSYVQGISDGGNFGGSNELRVKFDSNASNFNRKTYLRFDVSSAPGNVVEDAQLDISILNPPTAGTDGGLNWNFNVFGLNDGHVDEAWSESGINWTNAPANDTSSGNGVLGTATALGALSPTLTGRGTGGQVLSLTGSALDTFLASDTDGLVTFIVTRVEPQPNGANTVVHIFESKEAGVNAAPTLSFNAIPEPSAFLLAAFGMLSLGVFGWRRRWHLRISCRKAAILAAIAAITIAPVAQLHAAPVAYDPFRAGGSTPDTSAGEYETGTGFSNDDIEGQGPTVSGFVAGPWDSSSAFANFVYYRTESGQLDYTDGAVHLNTTPGQLNLFRSSGTSTADKDMFRDLSIGNSLPGNLYVSMLTQLTSGAELTVRSASWDGTNGNTRRFNFGINAAGNPFVNVTGPDANDTNTNIVVDPSVPHLLVAKLTDDGFMSDQIDLYLDPVLQDESFNTPVATIDGGNFYVGGNPAWTLRDIFFRNIVDPAGESIIMDELRIGATWQDVTPFTVPEPSSLVLGLAGLLGLIIVRRRTAFRIDARNHGTRNTTNLNSHTFLSERTNYHASVHTNSSKANLSPLRALCVIAISLIGFVDLATQADAQTSNAFFSFDTQMDGNGSVDSNVTAETFPGTPTRSRTGSSTSSDGGEASFADFQGNVWLGNGNFMTPGHSLAWNANSTGNSSTHFLDMTGLADLTLRMAIRSAANNATPISQFDSIEYDTGSGFTTAASGADLLIPVAGNSFLEYTLDLSDLSAIEKQSNVALRFTFGTVPANTSFRIDNVQFTAQQIPEPSTLVLAGAALLSLLFLGSRRRVVASARIAA